MPRVPIRWPISSATPRASSRCSSTSHTAGQTSSAPILGCTPWCWRMSISSIACSAPATRASARSWRSAARVNTLRLCLGSQWTFSTSALAPRLDLSAPIVRSLDPSEKLGTPSSRAGEPISDQQLALAHDRLAVELNRGMKDDAVEVDRHLDCAADPGGSAEGDVAAAEDLLVFEDLAGDDRLRVGADAELGDVGARLAVGGEQLHQLHPLPAPRRGQMAGLDHQLHRFAHPTETPDRAVDDQRPVAVDGRDEALAAGQVAEGPAL